MTPTLAPGDLLWIRKTRLFKRGQIAIVSYDGGWLVKRIVGLPGETVAIRRQHVHVDEKLLHEPYVPEGAYLEPKPDQTHQLRAASYLLLGDARDDSLDSRRIGPIAAKDIAGVAVCRLWPPKLL